MLQRPYPTMQVLPVGLIALVVVLTGMPVRAADAPAGTGVWWISITQKDADEVKAVLGSLLARKGEDGEGKPSIYAQTADRVIVSGRRDDYDLAQKLIEALPDQISDQYDLCVPASSSVVLACVKQAGVVVSQNHGCTLHARGSAEALARLAQCLGDRGLRQKPVTALVRLRYFRDPTAAITLLQSLIERFAPDVNVTPLGSATAPARASLILCGPPAQVDMLRRRIAFADVTLPQMRLDLWSIQISGSNARKVAAAAAQAQAEIDETRALVAEYLDMLQAYASDLQAQARGLRGQNEAQVKAAVEEQLKRLEQARRASPNLASASEWEAAREKIQKTYTDWAARTPPVAAALGSAGAASGSLPVVLALMEMGPDAGLAGFTSENETMRPLFERYEAWHRGLAPKSPPPGMDALVPTALFKLISSGGAGPSSLEQLADLVPLFDDPVAFETVDADLIATTMAGAQAELNACEDALNRDLRRIFLDPLLANLRETIGGATSSGMASCGTTSVCVLSGEKATVTGRAVSYFDLTQQPKLDEAALTKANSFGTALGNLFPQPTGATPSQWAGTVTLVDPKQADTFAEMIPAATGLTVKALGGTLYLVGSAGQVKGAVALLRQWGAVAQDQTRALAPAGGTAGEVAAGTAGTMAAASGLGSLLGSVSGIPVDRLLSLALALGPPERVWTAMTEGALLEFTPMVAPGGAVAELTIKATISHADPGTGQNTEGATAVVPLNRVAMHEADTKFNLQPLDLFSLSTFGLRTTHPRPDFVVPILGQIPFLGQMFRFRQPAQRVHHESLLLVHSTISPTASDLVDLLWAEMQRQELAPAATKP